MCEFLAIFQGIEHTRSVLLQDVGRKSEVCNIKDNEARFQCLLGVYNRNQNPDHSLTIYETSQL